MKKKMGRIATSILVAMCLFLVSINSYAHSGRTDSNGGHKDNKNKSGLGSYHYHCGGYPAHLHKNGVCPYKSKSSTTSSNKSSSNTKASSSKTTSSSSKPVSAQPVEIKATNIEINEKIESIFVGKSEILTANILPNNVTNKNITWKSNNEDIATISSKGEVIAKEPGSVTITASTSNGKTDTLKINIVKKIEESKEENIVENIEQESNLIISDTNNKMSSSNNIIENSEGSDAVGGVITLGALGGGYWLYRKNKKKKE